MLLWWGGGWGGVKAGAVFDPWSGNQIPHATAKDPASATETQCSQILILKKKKKKRIQEPQWYLNFLKTYHCRLRLQDIRMENFLNMVS